MDTLSHFVLELYRLAQETAIANFAELAMEMFKAVVRFRAAAWSEGALTQGGIEIFSVQLHGYPAEDRAQFVELSRRYSREITRAVSDPGRAHILNNTRRYYAEGADEAMRAYLKRHGHDRSLLIADLDQWLALYRRECDPPFSETDAVIASFLMPHVAEALTINRRIALGVPIPRSGRVSPCVRALVDRRGAFLHCRSDFLNLLRLEWRGWSEPAIPPALGAALAAAGRVRIAGDAVEIAAQRLGDAQLLIAHKVSPLERLSRREREVAEKFGKGQSYKAIALEAQLSPATVRNVLQRAYRKLRIDNKLALARLLDSEHS